MIVNVKNQSDTIRSRIENSECAFYLGGSRYFGTAQKDSDWDYFIQEFDKVDLELAQIGLRKVRGVFAQPYMDNNTIAVWAAEIWEVENVQVAVVKDAEARNAIQEVLRKNIILREALVRLPKNKRFMFWDAMYEIFSYT